MTDICLMTQGRRRLQLGKIKISSRTSNSIGMLKSATGLAPNVLLRFALCLSIKQQGIPNPDEYNKEGSEMSPEYIFGEHKDLYLALMLNRLKNDKLDSQEYLDEMTRSHVNRGMIGLRQRISNLSDFDGLVKEEEQI